MKTGLDYLGRNLTFIPTKPVVPPRTEEDGTPKETFSSQAKGMIFIQLFFLIPDSAGPAFNKQAPPTSPPPPEPEQQTLPPLEEPEKAPGGGTALVFVGEQKSSFWDLLASFHINENSCYLIPLLSLILLTENYQRKQVQFTRECLVL